MANLSILGAYRTRDLARSPNFRLARGVFARSFGVSSRRAISTMLRGDKSAPGSILRIEQPSANRVRTRAERQRGNAFVTRLAREERIPMADRYSFSIAR